MTSDCSISLVVPLFNEEVRFGETAKEIVDFVSGWGAGSEVIWVDDGSSDRTAEVVGDFVAKQNKVSARLLHIPHRGKGAAVRAGLLASEGTVAAFCDVDLATPLVDVSRLIEASARDGALVIGSRALPTSNVTRHESPLRELLGRTYNFVVRSFLTPGIFDTQCGAKACRSAVWARVLAGCREDGFAGDVEMITAAMALEVPVLEVGVTWAHDDRSRVHVWRDGLEMVVSLLRIWRRLHHPADKTPFLLYK